MTARWLTAPTDCDDVTHCENPMRKAVHAYLFYTVERGLEAELIELPDGSVLLNAQNERSLRFLPHRPVKIINLTATKLMRVV